MKLKVVWLLTIQYLHICNKLIALIIEENKHHINKYILLDKKSKFFYVCVSSYSIPMYMLIAGRQQITVENFAILPKTDNKDRKLTLTVPVCLFK